MPVSEDQQSIRRIGPLVLGLAATSFVLTSCGKSTATYPGLTAELLAAVNQQYAGQYSITVSSASVPLGKLTAATSTAKAIIHDCNEGSGATVVALGQVNINANPVTVHPSVNQSRVWAVFVNPRGSHIGPSTEPTPHPVVLNWYAGFLTSPTQPFCTFGYSRTLPRLPIH